MELLSPNSRHTKLEIYYIDGEKSLMVKNHPFNFDMRRLVIHVANVEKRLPAKFENIFEILAIFLA